MTNSTTTATVNNTYTVTCGIWTIEIQAENEAKARVAAWKEAVAEELTTAKAEAWEIGKSVATLN